MKKIGRLSDTALIKKAGSDPKRKKVAENLIKWKFAAIDHIISESEKHFPARLKKEAKLYLKKASAEYLPSEWFARKGEGEKVLKAAEAVICNVLKHAIAKVGEDKLYDEAATKKAAAEFTLAYEKALLKKNADIVAYFKRKEAASMGQRVQGEDPGKLGIMEGINQIKQLLATGLDTDRMAEDKSDELINNFSNAYDIHFGQGADAGDEMDLLAQLLSGDANHDFNDPVASFVEPHKYSALDIVDKKALATFDKIAQLVDAIGKGRKAAGMEDPVPNPAPAEGSAAQKTVSDTNKELETNDKTKESVSDEAGGTLDDLAEFSELEALLAEEGTPEKDQSNDLTSVAAVDTSGSDRKVNTEDKGGKTASANVFSTYFQSVVKGAK